MGGLFLLNPICILCVYIYVHTFITPISHCMLHMFHPMAMVLSEHFVSQKIGKGE